MVSVADIRNDPSLYFGLQNEQWKVNNPESAYIVLRQYPEAYATHVPAALKESPTDGLKLAKLACSLSLGNLSSVPKPTVLRELIRHHKNKQDPHYPFFHYLRGMGHDMRGLNAQLLLECVPLFKTLERITFFKNTHLTAFSWESCFSYQRYMILSYLDCMLCAARVSMDGIDHTMEVERALTDSTNGALFIIQNRVNWINGFIDHVPVPIIKMVFYCFHICTRSRNGSPLYHQLLEDFCRMCVGCSHIQNIFFDALPREDPGPPWRIDERPIADDKARVERILHVLYDFSTEPALTPNQIDAFVFKHWHEPEPYFHNSDMGNNPLGFELGSPGGNDPFILTGGDTPHGSESDSDEQLVSTGSPNAEWG